jgi:hypothetical protein
MRRGSGQPALDAVGADRHGTEVGGTELIPAEMYRAIEESQIIVIDLTGLRPNVCIEAGYALKHHLSGRLVFLFEPRSGTDRVPFDLSAYRYVEVAQAADIPDSLQPHLESIVIGGGARIATA